ncbi:MAG: methylmalonyl-CoA mutase small subunit [Marinilabiliales bacterium]
MSNFAQTKLFYMSEFENLFQDFNPVTKKEWKDKIISDLKGADYEKKMIWKTIEGFDIDPALTRDDLNNIKYLDNIPGAYPYLRGNKLENNKWQIRQDFCISTPEETNRKLKLAIEGGVDSIGLYNENVLGCPYSDAFANVKNFAKLFNGIDIEKISINYYGTINSAAFFTLLDEYAESINADNLNITGSIGYDPINYFVLTGKFHASEDVIFERAKSLIQLSDRLIPNIKIISVNGTSFHNAGASVVQELAFTLAAGTEYVERLLECGLKIDQIAPELLFEFSVGSNYFMEIAKFRAARYLWSKIIDLHEPAHNESYQMFIHAETSMWNKTIYDIYNNLLRTTTESMAAILGGVQSLCVQPFDKTFNKPNDFSERLARNQQLILKEEAYFDKIVDPAAGSYYIETITDKLIDKAWQLFLEIEEKGGFLEAFKAGFIQDKITETAKLRNQNIATKKEILLGTNLFPNTNEKLIDKLDEQISFPSRSSNDTIAQPLSLYRGGNEFEKLRIRTEKHTKQPIVFLLTFGDLAMRKARASFSANFFGCAGYKIIDNPGFKSLNEGFNEAEKTNADIIVLCSSDNDYTSIIDNKELIKNTSAITVLAGYPKELVDSLKEAGIEHFIHIKSNVLETLLNFHKKLNIK